MNAEQSARFATLLAVRRNFERILDKTLPKFAATVPDDGPPDELGLGWYRAQWDELARGSGLELNVSTVVL